MLVIFQIREKREREKQNLNLRRVRADKGDSCGLVFNTIVWWFLIAVVNWSPHLSFTYGHPTAIQAGALLRSWRDLIGQAVISAGTQPSDGAGHLGPTVITG